MPPCEGVLPQAGGVVEEPRQMGGYRLNIECHIMFRTNEVSSTSVFAGYDTGQRLRTEHGRLPRISAWSFLSYPIAEVVKMRRCSVQ